MKLTIIRCLLVSALLFMASCHHYSVRYGSRYLYYKCPLDSTGCYQEFLDEHLNPIVEEEAFFMRYTYCDEGDRIPALVHKFSRNLEIPGIRPIKDSIQVLDGEIAFYRKNKIRFTESYINGYLDTFVSYNKEKDTVEYIDQQVPYNKQPYFAKIEVHGEESKRIGYLVQKDGKWKLVDRVEQTK